MRQCNTQGSPNYTRHIIDQIVKPSPEFIFLCVNCRNDFPNNFRHNPIAKQPQNLNSIATQNDVKTSTCEHSAEQFRHSGDCQSYTELSSPPSQTTLNNILAEQIRFAKLLESTSAEYIRLAKLMESQFSRTKSYCQIVVSNASSGSNSTSSNEVFHDATSIHQESHTTITFSPHQSTSEIPNRVFDLHNLPTINYQNMDEYSMLLHTPDERTLIDYGIKTRTLKIIGVPTTSIELFTRQLPSKNMWINLKYIRVDRIYKTARSYSKSWNYILTLDHEAHQEICDTRKVIICESYCKAFDQLSIIPCKKCQSLYHSSEDCVHAVICKKLPPTTTTQYATGQSLTIFASIA